MNDYDQKIQAAMLRQRDASGRSGYQNPQGRMVGNTFVAPNVLEYLTAGLRSAGAGREAEMAGQETQTLQTERAGANQSAMANALRMMGGAPADAALPENVAGPVRGAQAPDLRGAYAELMKSPDYAQMGQQGMMQLPAMEAQAKAREDDRAFKAAEAQIARDTRAQELQMRMQDQRASQQERLDAQREMRQMQIDAQKDTQRMIAANRQAPQIQTLTTDAGMLERKGNEWVPISVGGKPVMPKGAAGAGNATEGERKAATLLQRMQGSEAQLEAALLKDKGAAKPGLISSGLSAIGMGTLANTATPENRQKVEAAQLDILDAALTLGTGAAYTKEQLEGYRKSYFPQLGDKPETVKDKQDRLNNVLSAARIAAGRAGGQVPTPVAPTAPNINALLDKYK